MNTQTKELLKTVCHSRGCGQATTHSILFLIASHGGLTEKEISLEEANALVDRALKYF